MNFNSSPENDLEIDNLPNRLTIFRILLIPIVLVSLYLTTSTYISEEWTSYFGWVAAITFGIASITDFFDGHIARKRKIVTVFGSFLDPIADKFLTVSSLIMLGSMGKIPAIIVIILVLREMFMTSLRLLASGEGIKIPVGKMGKWKTATQMIGLPMIMTGQDLGAIPLPLVGTIFIYIASVLSIWSSIDYTLSMIQKMKARRLHIKEQKRLKKLEKKKSKELDSTNE